MFARSLTGALILSVALLGSVLPSSAQFRRVVPDNMVNTAVYAGGNIRFCINPVSSLAQFDRALGQTLADMLLVPAEFYELKYAVAPAPWGYDLALGEEDLFIQLSENCDAVLGFPMPFMDLTYSWLTTTSPYYTPRFALAFAKDAPPALDQLPEGSQFGSRVGTLSDMQVRAYARSSANKLKRRVYASNVSLIRALASGDLLAAVVWEPAVAIAAQTEPGVADIQIVTPPFGVEPQPFAIALPSNQTYLREMLDTAINQLRASEEFSALLAEFELPEE